MKRKSAVDLTDLALGILILGITVVIGARILINYRDNRLTDLSTGTVVNESVAMSGGDQLSTSWYRGIDACVNATGTGGAVVPSTYYTVTVDSVNGYATVTNSTAHDQTLNCTYSYYDTTEAQWALPNNASLGLAEYGNWFDIIVIVGIAGLILALIFMAFGRNSGGEGVTY
jgi:hypothetical protein